MDAVKSDQYVAGMGISGAGVDTDALSALILAAKASGGAEIANTQKFIERLCDAMGLPAPSFSASNNAQNDYAYERRITFKHPDGSQTPGRIDLYKRGCFVLESKQSSQREARAQLDQLSFLPVRRSWARNLRTSTLRSLSSTTRRPRSARP